MKTMTVDKARAGFDELAIEARHGPVTVTFAGESPLVLLSLDEYERLLGRARDDLKNTIARLRAGAASTGLSEEKLAEIMSDDS
jgi:prevent-host-death family protein